MEYYIFQSLCCVLSGVTPTQLYHSTIGYLLDVVLPSRFNPSTRTIITPPFKISKEWALNTINNIALYVARVGVHPPIGPLQIPELGVRQIERGSEAVRLVEASMNNQLQCIDSEHTIHMPDEENLNSGINGLKRWPSSLTCKTRIESLNQHNDTDLLTVENTLFKDVRALPFHIDAFSLLSSHRTH